MIIDFYNRGGGSGGGVTTGQVQDMITSALTAEEETLYTELQSSVDIPVSDAQMTGLTPTDMESNDGSIFKSTNGTYWEGYNKEDKFVQRKGVYNRVVEVTALTDFNDAEEGDVAVLVGAEPTWVTVSAEDFADLIDNGTWTAGTTYQITADTSNTPSGNKALRGGFTTANGTVYLGFGYRNGVWGFEFGSSQNWTSWDGSAQTWTVPEFTAWNTYMYSSPEDVCTIKQQEGGAQTRTQYQRINGQWVEPASKDYVNNVVGDIENALASI